MSKILEEVHVGSKNLKNYKKFLKEKNYQALKNVRNRLKNLSIIHVNSSSDGGGVAELLKSQIPFERALGIDSHWIVLNGEKHKENFFAVTKKIHNFLQGQEGDLTKKEKELYLLHNKHAYPLFQKIIKKIKPDIVVIHDPQPASLLEVIPDDVVKIIRLHIDLSHANKKVLEFFKDTLMRFDALVVTAKEYRPEWFPKERMSIIQPSIDPLLDKNKIITRAEAKKILEKNKIKTDKYIIAQVSRFDVWKDPIGVIHAFRIAKKEIPDMRLILIGSDAVDDPESKKVLKEVKKITKGDSDIILITENNNKLVGAIQSYSSAILQKSLREGFGLTVAEAMWNNRAVIGGDAVGIKLQIKHNKNGVIVKNEKEAAKAIIKFIKNPKFADKLGKEAYKTVKQNFLLPHMEMKYIKLYEKMLKIR